MSQLDALYRQGALRALDHALGQSLRRLDRAGGDETPDPVSTAAALASLAVAQGHAAFDPARPHLACDEGGGWPDPQIWLQALRDSRWVATPQPDEVAATGAPLVLERGLLYLRRYREYERRLAQRLMKLAGQPMQCSPGEIVALAPLFASLFPGAQDGGDLQARAAALALLQSLLLISGGPGTGKTTTIARVLLLLVAQARNAGRPPPRIALAAPTGRAAERMAESLRAATAELRKAGVEPALIDALPAEARTVHRLLGSIPDSPQFRHGTEQPLPFEVVVVDEASMVDLPLMCKLAEAVADGARLILLGDRDQLPSVEAGDVLAAIDDAAGADLGLAHGLERTLSPLLGSGQGDATADAGAGADTPALAGHRVRLQRGYRQSGELELAPLAAAIRRGDADLALSLLRGGELAGVHFHEDVLDPLAALPAPAAGGGVDFSSLPAASPDDRIARESTDDGTSLLITWSGLADADDPVAALALAARLRLLTALREGPQGSRMLNARIEAALAGVHHSPYFHGRLLLVTENSYRQGLFNGDIGVCMSDRGAGPPGRVAAWFPGEDGVRSFHPSALPAHESAFAMTVHKSQGSEFDRVWLQLPRNDGRGVSRELLYTAVTRARREVHVCASEAVLRGAISRHGERVSGLAWRLRADLG
ncbi:MAG: exodeoxyribonuclease V subunit alpha [Pseudomonadota bacterium]|nr:exodeoxyribonuclease V subunit alpha [Pseudomonadota bacterium]